jgi:hypothetical protein
MADRIGGVYVEIGAMMDGFNRAINEARVKSGNLDRQLNDNVTRTSSAFSGMGKTIVGVSALIGAALGVMYVKMARQAMDAVETQQKFGVVFRDTLEAANAAVTNLADNYGLATTEARDMLSATGDLLTGFGMTGEQALQLSERTQQLAVDLASFTNYSGGARGASEALTKAMLGEREMLKSLGIVIRESDIKQRLASMGMANATGVARMQAQAQATLALAYEQSTNAIGDFARSANSPANVIRRVQSSLQNISEEIGETMLPGLQELGLAFIEASRDGGVMIQAAKAIGDLLSKAGMSIAYVIRMLDTINKKNALQENMDRAATATGNTRVQMNQLEASMQGVRNTGLSTATTYNAMIADLDRLAAGSGSTAQAANTLSSTLRAQRAEIERSGASAQRAQNAASGQIGQYERAYTELTRLGQRIRGVTTNTEELAAQRARDRQRTQEQTTATGDQSKALAKLKKDLESVMNSLATFGMGEGEQAQADATRKQQILDRGLAENLITREQYNQAVIQLERQTAQQVEEIQKKSFMQTTQNVLGTIGTVGSLVSQLGQLYSLSASNQTAELENQQTEQMALIAANYDQELAIINSSITDKTQRDAALKALDEKRAREEKKLQEQTEKEKRKIAREAAKKQKQIAVFETLINIPSAAFAAFKSAQWLPFPASAVIGGALAAAATALGFAKLALIQQTPLPAAAKGIYAESPYIGGEAGPELAFPLSSERGRAALSLFSEQFINKLGEGSATKAPEATIGNSAGNMFRVVVNLGSKVLYDDITEATANGEIMVHARAIV